MPEIVSVILAAGKGTRMKSGLPKVLHKVCGKPMLDHVVTAAVQAGVTRNMVVVGHEAAQVKELDIQVEWVEQTEQLGTGHAVLQSEPLLRDLAGHVLILCGDTPLIKADTLARLLKEHQESGDSATILTAFLDDPTGYGRIVRGDNEQVKKIVEHKDASGEEREISEINTGIYCFKSRELFDGLKKISPANSQGEYYLTDVIAILGQQGASVGAISAADPWETMGVNDRVQLADAEKILRYRKLKQLMIDGVTIMDPDNTYIDLDVEIGPDSVIYPGTIIQGQSRLGDNCQIGPYAQLSAVEVGDSVVIRNSVIIESVIGNNVNIGPFAYIRPGTVLASDVKVGDFVEIKKSIVGQGTKIPHLSYIGDAEIGERVNVGAGTITCNYDGAKKWNTKIGNNAFIGSNANLVAPVEIGDGAVIGAGSTVTKDVSAGALCVERGKQEIYPDWVARKNEKK